MCEKERQTDREYDGEGQKGVRERETDGLKRERHTYRQRETYIYTEKEKQMYRQVMRKME